MIKLKVIYQQVFTLKSSQLPLSEIMPILEKLKKVFQCSCRDAIQHIHNKKEKLEVNSI